MYSYRKALIYCLGHVDYDKLEDGEYRSRTVYDYNGNAHWVAIDAQERPHLRSECETPFAAHLAPYTAERVVQS